MEAEQLIARVQELTGRLEDLEDDSCRELAEELTARGRADVRRRARADRRADRRTRRSRDRLAADELVAGLLHDPRPVPGAARGAGDARRSTACGPTWSRTAATSSCSGSRTAWRSCASRAAASPAARRPRRSSWRCARRCEEAAPDLLGMDVEGVVEEEPELHGRPAARACNGAPVLVHAWRSRRTRARSPRPQVDGRAARGRERGRARCSPTATACASCGGALGGGRARAAARSPARPAAAATSCRRRAARWTTTTCSSSPSRCCGRPRRSRWRCEAAGRGGREPPPRA